MSVLAGWGERARGDAAADGRWRATLPTPGAGGPFSLAVKGSSKVEIVNVMLGEVWFASGQSNMDMRMRGNTNQPIIGSNEAILQSANDRIRLYTVARQWGEEPLDDVEGAWAVAGPESVKAFSAGGLLLRTEAGSAGRRAGGHHSVGLGWIQR